MTKGKGLRALVIIGLGTASVAALFIARATAQGQAPFQIEEATIASVHRAIKEGRTTCRQIWAG